MQTHSTIASQSKKELAEQLCVHLPNFIAVERDAKHAIRPIAQIYRGPTERFIHRHIGMAVAGDATEIAKRLFDRFSDHNAGVFDSVVTINVQVTNGFDGQIDKRMPAERIQHMVKETYAGRDVGFSGAIQIETDCDVSLFRGPGYGRDTISHAGQIVFKFSSD